MKRIKYELMLNGVSFKSVSKYKTAQRWKRKKLKEYKDIVGYEAPSEHFRIFKVTFTRKELA